MKKNYTIHIPVRLFWTRFVPLALLFLGIGTLAGIFFIDIVVMPNVGGIDRGMVSVPSIVGLQVEQGREALYGVGLLTEIQGREFDNTVPKDNIISQSPLPGLKVKKGRRINIVVSKGAEFADVPDLTGMTERQARIELKKKGFLIGEVTKKFDDEKPVDIVINSFPQSGTTISRDMKLALFISKGAKPTHTEMPNIVGENINEAQKKLEESGLTTGKVSYKSDQSLLPGTVVSQSVSPGENVPLESPVDLTVSVIKK